LKTLCDPLASTGLSDPLRHRGERSRTAVA
jgi:hypothetical protein